MRLRHKTKHRNRLTLNNTIRWKLTVINRIKTRLYWWCNEGWLVTAASALLGHIALQKPDNW